MYDVIVVGGGIAGTSAAYHACREGAHTLLLDRKDAGRATKAAAGILSPLTRTSTTQAWYEFAREAVAYYPTLIELLQSEQAGEVGYSRCGLLLVASSIEEEPAFELARKQISQRTAAETEGSHEEYELISPRNARAMFPPLGEVAQALYHAGAARIDGLQLNWALRRAAIQNGLVSKKANVERLIIDGERAKAVIANGESYECGQVVLAPGAWIGEFSEQVGANIPVTPQRGQLLHLTYPIQETGKWPIVSTMRSYYLVSWPNGHIVVGATRESGSGYQAGATAAGVVDVLAEALRVAPDLARAEFVEAVVGLRPVSADGVPILGKIPAAANVTVAAGQGSSGLQLGPFSGKLAAQLALGQAVEQDLTAFRVNRFSGLSAADFPSGSQKG